MKVARYSSSSNSSKFSSSNTGFEARHMVLSKSDANTQRKNFLFPHVGGANLKKVSLPLSFAFEICHPNSNFFLRRAFSLFIFFKKKKSHAHA